VPWVRFDDQYPIHRKVDGLSDAAFRLHTSAIFWSARNLTDGFVSQEDLAGVTARVRTPARFAAECVRRGVWHGASEPCDSQKCPGPVDSDGWIIHDYWQYQPKKVQVISARDASARRQAAWRAKHNGSSNAVTHAVSEPVPPRPEGKRGGGAAPGARASPAGPRGAWPPWCGHCDERTRCVLDDNHLPSTARCPKCHPKAAPSYWDRFTATGDP
jgi:hypothetical protein